MRAYNVEIFSNQFDFICADTVEDVGYKFDYLAMETNSIMLVTDAAIMQGDYIHIKRGDDEFFGVVSGTSSGENKGTVNVEYKPFTSIFSANILFDTNQQGQGTLENRLKAIIESYWKNNSDSAQNIPGLRVTTTSSTTGWGFNLKSDTEGMHHLVCNFHDTFIIRSMEKYGVAIKVTPYFHSKNIIVSIGNDPTTPTVIEADLPNIIEKNISIKESDFDVNKLVLWNTADYTSSIIYYRHTDDTYDTTNRDRITPVVFETIGVMVDQGQTFAAVAASQAAETFGSIEYNNLIELSVRMDDKLIRPRDFGFGRKVIVRYAGNEYNSMYTGCEIGGGIYKLIFGTVRIDLTKILQRRNK